MLQKKLFADTDAYVHMLQSLSPGRILDPEEVLFCAIQDNHEPTFDAYIQYPGIDLNYPLPGSGVSMLHIAVEYNRRLMAERLLFCGADPNMQDQEDGRTALVHALLKERYDFASLLLSYGANPALATFDGITPVLISAERNNVALTNYMRDLF